MWMGIVMVDILIEIFDALGAMSSWYPTSPALENTCRREMNTWERIGSNSRQYRILLLRKYDCQTEENAYTQ